MAQATGAKQQGQTGSAATWRDRGMIEIPQGRVRVREIGEGEPLLFVHGFLVDGRLWDGVAERLAGDFRCIVPDWPEGSHPEPMRESADVSPPGQTRIIAALMDALDLKSATLVGNDSGGAVSQIFSTTHPERVERLILTNCDTHDNFPPKAFKPAAALLRLPGAAYALIRPVAVGPIGRAAFAPFAKKKIDPALITAWAKPSKEDRGVLRDARNFILGASSRQTEEAAKKLESFEAPVLLVWAPEDPFFKLSYAKRLEAAIPNARIVEVPDAKTFVPLDQPAKVAEAIRSFVKPAP